MTSEQAVDITDSQTRMRITHRLEDTGDVTEVTFREHGTDELPDDITQGVTRPIPTLHITLSSGNITNAVMRVLTDEGLSITPLTTSELLADAESPGKIWNLSPEVWAQFVRHHSNYTNASVSELHKLAKEMVDDDEGHPEITTLDEAFEDIDAHISLMEAFITPLTDEQYDVLLQVGELVSLDELNAEGLESHVAVHETTPGALGIALNTDSSEGSLEDRLRTRQEQAGTPSEDAV